MIFQHPAIRYGVTIYLASDELAQDIAVAITTTVPFPSIAPEREPDTLGIIKALGGGDCVGRLAIEADDWRLMTKAEVDAYLERNRERNA